MHGSRRHDQEGERNEYMFVCHVHEAIEPASSSALAGTPWKHLATGSPRGFANYVNTVERRCQQRFRVPREWGQESGRVVDFRGLEVAFKLCRELCRELRRTQQSPDRHHNPDRNRCEGAQAPAPPPPASRDCLREEGKTCGSLLAKHFTPWAARPLAAAGAGRSHTLTHSHTPYSPTLTLTHSGLS